MDSNTFSLATIRSANMGDAEEIADILGEAFSNDPVMSWMFGSPGSQKETFLELARKVYLRHGFGHLADDGAAALWLPAGATANLPLMSELAVILHAMRCGGPGAVHRGWVTERAMKAGHPEAPHFYLFAVGVREKMKGKGLGGSIIRAGLKRADEAGASAYLENSNPKNTPLYTRLGFEAIAPLSLPANAPPLLGMMRQTRKQVA